MVDLNLLVVNFPIEERNGAQGNRQAVTDKARAQRNRSETSPSLQMGVCPTRKAVQRAATSISAQRQAEMVVDNGGESYQSNQESFEEVPSNQTVSAQGEKRKSKVRMPVCYRLEFPKL